MSDMLTVSDVASMLDVKPSTIRKYSSDKRMPQPDGHLGRTPWWKPETISAWMPTRPGQGVGGGRPRKEAVSV